MVPVVVVVIVLVCVAAGVWFYLHGGPDGGRDPGLNREESRALRMNKRLADDKTFEKAEERFQEEQNKPPTHDEQ